VLCFFYSRLGEKYNVKGEAELDNLEVARFIAKELGQELVYEMHDNPQVEYLCVFKNIYI